jgi:hypothetical protein
MKYFERGEPPFSLCIRFPIQRGLSHHSLSIPPIPLYPLPLLLSTLLDLLCPWGSMDCIGGCGAQIPDGGKYRCSSCLRAKKRELKRNNRVNFRTRNPLPPPSDPSGQTPKQRARAKAKETVDKLKAGRPCADCGHSYHPVAMDWDHRPGEGKTRDVSQCRTVTQVMNEVALCDLVCSNCHRVRTHLRAGGSL